MPNAAFLKGCTTVHEYKNKLATLRSAARHKSRSYEIAECYVMDYDKYIWLCNHINERFKMVKKKHSKRENTVQVALFFCTKDDKVLLLSFAD